MNEYALTLDLAKAKQRQQQTIFVRQGDRNATTIVATITDHGAAAATSGLTARFQMRLPDGTHYYRKAASLSGNVATVTIDEAQAASAVGRTDVAYFQLLQGSTVVASTESFTVVVLTDALADAEVAESYDSAIQDAIDALDAAVEQMPDIVEDVLTAHPEWTTTVQDGSITKDKLDTDLARDRERLLYRLDNLLTAQLPEGETATASDAARTPMAALALYGKSTQDGTPTPSAPVPIVSVAGNLLDPSTFVARGGGVDTISDGFVSDSTPTADASGWTWAHRTFDVTLPAGTYTVCFCVRAQGRSSSGYAVVTEAGATIVSPTSDFAPSTFTLDETTNVGIKIKTYEAVVACMVFGGTLSANPSAYVPYGHVGLWARGRNLFDATAVTTVIRNGSTGGGVRYQDGVLTNNKSIGAHGYWAFNFQMYLPVGAGGQLTVGFDATLSGTNASSGLMVCLRDGMSAANVSSETALALTKDSKPHHEVTLTVNQGHEVGEPFTLLIEAQNTGNTVALENVVLSVGTEATYQPYESTVTPIHLDGHELRSLPDGTRDELTVDERGHAVLVQKVGSVTLDGSSDENYTLSGNKLRVSYVSDVIRRAPNGNTLVQLLSDRFVAETSNQNYAGNVGASIGTEGYIGLCRTGAVTTVAAEREWLASNPTTVLYPLATPVTHDLGYVDAVPLVGPDLTAQAIPTAPMQLTYERDLNTTLARLESAIATLA